MATPLKSDRPLTLKQRRFVEELPFARSQTEAAIKAGYPPGPAASVRASEAVRNRRVQAALQAQRQAVEEALVAQLGERKRVLSDIIRTRQPGPYPVQAAIQASDQLNRMEGVYVERTVSLNANVELTELEGFSLEELKALLRKTK